MGGGTSVDSGVFPLAWQRQRVRALSDALPGGDPNSFRQLACVQMLIQSCGVSARLARHRADGRRRARPCRRPEAGRPGATGLRRRERRTPLESGVDDQRGLGSHENSCRKMTVLLWKVATSLSPGGVWRTRSIGSEAAREGDLAGRIQPGDDPSASGSTRGAEADLAVETQRTLSMLPRVIGVSSGLTVVEAQQAARALVVVRAQPFPLQRLSSRRAFPASCAATRKLFAAALLRSQSVTTHGTFPSELRQIESGRNP